jgi:DNA-directed RNA polymerase specialized sigma24 family protein
MEHSIAQSEDKRKVAAEYLKLAARDLDRATQVRIHYVILARKYGLTNQQIGSALGVSEAAVRSLVTRNGGA